MINIHLLNAKEFRDNVYNSLEIKGNFEGTLFFKTSNDDVKKCLMMTTLIPDLHDIIMTYVNDEFQITYSFVSANGDRIQFNLNSVILVSNYYVSFSMEIFPLRRIIVKEDNNMIRLNFITEWSSSDAYNYYLNNFFHIFAKEHGIDLYEEEDVVLTMPFSKTGKNEYLGKTNSKHVLRLNIYGENKLVNFVKIIKQIDTALSEKN